MSYPAPLWLSVGLAARSLGWIEALMQCPNQAYVGHHPCKNHLAAARSVQARTQVSSSIVMPPGRLHEAAVASAPWTQHPQPWRRR